MAANTFAAIREEDAGARIHYGHNFYESALPHFQKPIFICENTPGLKDEPYEIALRVNTDGSVTIIRSDAEHPMVECVKNEIRKITIPPPPMTPIFFKRGGFPLSFKITY